MYRQISLRLAKSLDDRLRRLATRADTTKSCLLRQALIDQIDDLEDFHLARAVSNRVVEGRESRVLLTDLDRTLARRKPE